MLREHAPLIAVSLVTVIMFYLVFRDLRSLRRDVTTLATPAPATTRKLLPGLMGGDADKAEDEFDGMDAMAQEDEMALPDSKAGGDANAARPAQAPRRK
jgi:hypothetical protein